MQPTDLDGLLTWMLRLQNVLEVRTAMRPLKALLTLMKALHWA